MKRYDLWRDLELGEEIKVGDRCLGRDGKWFLIEKRNLEITNELGECHRMMQRKCATNYKEPE